MKFVWTSLGNNDCAKLVNRSRSSCTACVCVEPFKLALLRMMSRIRILYRNEGSR